MPITLRLLVFGFDEQQRKKLKTESRKFRHPGYMIGGIDGINLDTMLRGNI